MAQTIYTTCNPLAEDCTLWQNNGRTVPAAAGIYSDGTTCYIVSSGIIVGTDVCVTTTSTTTTTTTVPAFYYSAGQVLCGDCPNEGATVTAFSPTSLIVGRYYNPGDGYVYKIISSVSGPSYDIDLTGATGNTTNCNVACIG